MEVIFLKRSNLEVLDYGFVDSDYQIVIDSVIPQKSTFAVNKQSINADVGDLLVVKDKEVNYIGIIVSMEEDDKKFDIKVQTADFISILDIQTKVTSYSGNLSLYLQQLINAAYRSNSDPMQNIGYLSIDVDYGVTGSLNFEADTISTISSLVEILNKAYGIGVFYSLVYTNGRINGVKFHIKNCTSRMKLKSNLAAISNLVVSNDNTQSTNKIVFVPSSENTSHRTTICYYLLKNGQVVTNALADDRYDTICSVTKIYKDNDYDSLLTTAQSEMLASSLEHSITFDLRTDNKVVVPFKDIGVGDFVTFITPTKTYSTMVTQITLKNTLAIASITLGEYRGSLTDKIKLLSKK